MGMLPVINIDESTFRSQLERIVLKQFKKGCRAGMQTVMAAVESMALSIVPRVTGNLAHSIGTRIEGDGFDIVGWLKATASYAAFVHDGTGVYGPRGAPAHFWRRPARIHKATYSWAGTIMGVKVKAKRTIIRGNRSGGGAAIEVISMGQKAQPFFDDAIRQTAPQLSWLFFQGFFRAIDKPR